MTRSTRPEGREPWVLGLAGSHNGAAALYRGHRLVCAVQEERLTRKKRQKLHPGEPSLAVQAVLADQGIGIDDLDLIVSAPLTGLLDPRDDIARHPELSRRPHRTISHHLAHALSAYACAGYHEATALVVDGLGSFARDLETNERRVARPHADHDREAVSLYRFDRQSVTPLDKHLVRTSYRDDSAPTPLGPFSSLGLMYQQVARFTFGSWDAAGKVMGLAPLGRPIHSISEFLDLQDDGRIAFNDDLFGIGGLISNLALAPFPNDRQAHADLAASVQRALEEGLMHLVRHARTRSDGRALVCAGGVFLNGVANEKILRSRLFEEVFYLPFAEDSGTAVGAAFFGVRELLGDKATPSTLRDDSLGPRPTDTQAALSKASALGAHVDRAPSLAELVDLLDSGAVVGFFSGRSELGPRALGHRALLYDPRRDDREALNRRKGREDFRPFAPAIRIDAVEEWLDHGGTPHSDFMLRVMAVLEDKRAKVPAITHVDGTTRPQVIERGHPLWAPLGEWHARTGVPMLLMTSFNRAGEPMVETVCDAVQTAFALELDALWIEDTWERSGSGELGPHRSPILITFRKR